MNTVVDAAGNITEVPDEYLVVWASHPSSDFLPTSFFSTTEATTIKHDSSAKKQHYICSHTSILKQFTLKSALSKCLPLNCH